jgi:hypothetical protein
VKSAALAVLCAGLSAVAGLTTFMFIGAYLGKNYGSHMGDGMLGLFGGALFGFVLGLVLGIRGARRWNNRMRLVVSGLAAVIAIGALTALSLMVSMTPER